MTHKINYSHALKMLVSEVIFDSRPMDKSMEFYFKNTPGLNPKEKEQLFNILSFVIRYWLTLREIYSRLFSKRNVDFHEILHIQQILENSLYGKLNCQGRYELQVKDILGEISEIRHIKESIPQWLDQRCYNELHDAWNELLPVLNRKPQITLRVNNFKTGRDSLAEQFQRSGKSVVSLEGYPDAILVNSFFDVFKSEEFQAGLFEVQDAGSQLIAPFLDAEPGMRVVDACAGNGGKTLHLADQMKNKGKIIALDIASQKLDTLKRRICRAGVFNIETRLIDSAKTIKRLYNSADRLLLDVPCSGLGVLKRNPDIKYHLSEEKLLTLNKTQEEILGKYASILSNKGVLVYSTCSILPSENQAQVQKFIEKMQGRFELMEEKTISPLAGFDGFYMAKIKRCG